RWLEADVETPEGYVTVVSAYVHTGEVGTDKQRDKYAFLETIGGGMPSLRRQGATVITGDFNICHGQLDLKNWKGNRGKAGFLPEEQAHLSEWFEQGWTDVVRAHVGEVPGPYTWWSWRGKAFDNDAGWRIDYQLATAELAERAKDAVVDRAPAYDQRFSDHAPLRVTYDL